MRWVSALNEAAAELDDIVGAYFLDLSFVSGHVRVNDSGHEIEWGGFIWYGVGQLGSFESAEESVDFIARGERYELNGVNPDLIATITAERYQGRPVTRYVGLFNPDGTLVDDPEVAWTGYMDTMDVEVEEANEGGSGSRIMVSAEHRLRSTPPFARWSDADQKARSSGDRFFDLATMVESFVSQWGDKQTTFGPKAGGGYGPG